MMWIVCNNIFVSNSVGGYVRNFAYSGPLLLYETHQLPICYTCTLPDPFFICFAHFHFWLAPVSRIPF